MADRGKEREKISSAFPPYDGKSDKELFRLYHEDKSNIKLRNELVNATYTLLKYWLKNM